MTKKMIRSVNSQDASSIAKIYSEYVLHSTITFETNPVTIEEMGKRILNFSNNFPYFVYEEDANLLGYCYVHNWTE